MMRGYALRRCLSTYKIPLASWSLKPPSGVTACDKVVDIAQLEKLSCVRAKDGMEKGVQDIIHWMSQIHDVDTTGLEPMISPSDHDIQCWTDPVPIINPMPLYNTPNVEMGYYVAPKTLG